MKHRFRIFRSSTELVLVADCQQGAATSAPAGSARYFYVSKDLQMKYTSPEPFIQYKYFTKSMYLFITDISYVHSFSIKFAK